MAEQNQIPRKIIIKVIVAMCAITSKEIQDNVHISKSYVSRYFNGERNCMEIDIYIIEKIFGIKIKDYLVND